MTRAELERTLAVIRVNEIVTHGIVLARIWLAFVDERIAELAGVAAIAFALKQRAEHDAVAVLAWIHVAVVHFALAHRSIEADRALASETAREIVTRSAVLALDVCTVVDVGLTFLASEPHFTQTHASKSQIYKLQYQLKN